MKLFFDIWSSFRSLPLWVQIWVALILVPINMAPLFFIDQPSGIMIAILAIIGIAPNIGVIIMERGFSKLMALPHLLPWSILIAILLINRPEGSQAYQIFLWALLIINTVSLLFDYPDAYKWWKGDRNIAGYPEEKS